MTLRRPSAARRGRQDMGAGDRQDVSDAAFLQAGPRSA